ncbi:MAG: sigma-E factor negative regulatory protein [Steroidobacteraceae bacterium]|nr:sigma-E factor negative regulatory protein [Nevskiaceae bacterium]MCP5339664.1 sigma-E factor negative regulatory protein [Nevskiaceae bacterium]MCP5360683.1 sigma-E factor negative regulatory protein [Nevskiaceae bacterium]
MDDQTRDLDLERGAQAAREAGVSSDERDSQLSAMFDGELADSECELLARRLSRDPALQRHWARYALIGAVMRDEPLHARRMPGGQIGSGFASRLSMAIEAEAQAEAASAAATPLPAAAAAAGPASGMTGREAAAAGRRWLRPAAGLGIAAGVAALAVFGLQTRLPEEASPPLAVTGSTAPAVEVIAPPVVAGGAATEIVVARSDYLPAVATTEAGGSREPESYVVPLPTERLGIAPPAQLANYVVAHSEYSGSLSRRSLLSALVAADAAAAAAGSAGVPVAVSQQSRGAAVRLPERQTAEAPR